MPPSSLIFYNPQKFTSYWRFEYCYKGAFTQFHEEETGKITWEIGLGTHNPSVPGKLIPKKSAVSSFFFTQQHTDGWNCEEINQKRRVNVRFDCKPTLYSPFSELQLAMHLEEKSLCNYEFVFSTPLLCPNYWGSFLNQVPEDSTEADVQDYVKEEE